MDGIEMAGDANQLLQAAFQKHQASQLAEAEALYRQVLEIEPDHADALHLRGLIFQQVNQHEEAVALIGRAAELAPDTAFYRVNLANSLIALGRSEDAANSLRAAIAADPNLADAHYNLGNLLTESGDAVAAAEAFQRAVGLQPIWAEALYGLGLALISSGQGDAGAEALGRSIEAKPDWAEPHAALGAVRADRQDWRQAEVHYRAALKHDGEMVTALIGLADVRAMQHDWEEARTCYYKAVELAPDNLQAQVQLGQLLIKQGWFLFHYYKYDEGNDALDEAAALFDKAIAADPDDAPALAGLGNLRMIQGDWNAAEEACSRALELEPDYEPARHTLSQTLLYEGKLEAAEAHCRTLLEMAPDPSSMGCIATRHALPHVIRWRGTLDGLIHYGDAGNGDGDLPDAAPLRAAGVAPLAVLSDHDFRLRATFADLPGDGGEYVLLRDQPATRGGSGRSAENFGYLLAWRDGGLVLSLGDGRSWSVLDSVAIDPGRDLRPGFAFALTRLGDVLTVEIDGETVLRTALPIGFTLPGDTLRVGTGSCAPQRFRLDIATATPAPTAAQRVDLLNVFYGDMFSRMLCDTLFPSLMLPDNLPALMRERDIVQNIYCSSQELPLIRRHLRALDKTGIGHTVNTEILDAGGDWVRNRIYLAVVDQIEQALDSGAVIVMAPPDHVFGRGLARMIDAMGPADYLLAGHPRVDMEPAFFHFRDLFRDPDATAALDNAGLVDFAMHRMPHHVVTTGLANPDEFWWNARRDGDAYKVRFKEPPPLAFQPSRDLINVITGAPFAPPFETIDHDIVDLMQRTGRLKWIDDSREFFWIEYCKMSRNVPTIRNTYWSPAARMLGQRELTWYL